MTSPRSIVFIVVALVVLVVGGSANAGPRARDLGVPFPGKPGPLNAITDVAGVEVGFSTVIQGDPAVDETVVRTGVTAIFPLGRDALAGAPAACFAFNGVGEMTGSHFLHEYGTLYTPVLITNTLAVGVAHDTYLRWMRDRIDAPAGRAARALPVVAETWDGFLNDIFAMPVEPRHVVEALESARPGPVAEGNVGGGTGMRAFRFKAGTGTASRVVTIDGERHVLGVLVQANFGRREELRVAGVPVGEAISDLMPEVGGEASDDGSIIVVVATDAPLLPGQLQRLARRGSLAIGRLGGVSHNTSGDLFLAFSTANATRFGDAAVHTFEALAHEVIDPLFTATVQATEEAVVNALVAAETMIGTGGHVLHALPHDRLRAVLARYGRLGDPGRAAD